MFLIDHVAESRFVNRLIYAIKRIYTHIHYSVKLQALVVVDAIID